ncbi:LTA synthase family protein [Chryseobacterium carnipullorum]|nr:alkaline phosphatase family protein [Chryseobacterium carnipullorum]MBV6878844.1 sulfatase-like hydrolase/transferase [Epilithonimonas sp. FP105]OAH71672.1 sulfatase [Chryseobacterium sp. FP211-J200]HBV17531.1 sulfatase [Chryseobacterium carnipullorum]
MKLIKIKRSSYSLLINFFLLYIIFSFVLRIGFSIASLQKAEISFLSLLNVFALGFLFDIGVGVFFVLPYSLYLLLFPQKYNNSLFNRAMTFFCFNVAVLILLFSFFAEVTFWQEFESRFNFIAVDYLVYTYEVINNINESYPLPLLITAMLIMTSLVFLLFYKRHYFTDNFKGSTPFLQRFFIFFGLLFISVIYAFFIDNSLAENSENRYRNELSKSGIYSFFSAYKNNEINYEHFYKLIDNRVAFNIVRTDLQESNSDYLSNDFSILRNIKGADSYEKPNVIMITLESFSADFMKTFGNNQNLTPTLDSLANQSILFTNMYATGTRTVRGMEALSLAVPPTPGNSIVRRKENDNLSTVGSIFSQKGYDTSFLYGGDGYFDNMNNYFGNNGYTIVDRKRNSFVGEDYQSPRIPIEDKEVTFENAWGISDENLYDQVIKQADKKFAVGKPFYDFVMNTSNHRPYTYPEGKIDIPSGSGREGAVKYTDYAIGQFFKKIKNKPWYKNTIVIIVADHCASSAGKNDIDVAKYHIPAMIVNLNNKKPFRIEKMCSQIDLYPTLFSLLGWTYESNLYGKNVLSETYTPRIFVSTYQKLGYMENNKLVILGPQQKTETYLYDKENNKQNPEMLSEQYVKKAIANYQSAYYLFKNDGLKQKQIKKVNITTTR